AMTRMEEEADQLGADGIVGVRLDIGRYEWGADLAEFISVGTAVRHRGGELHRAPNGRPFTSDLSGQDFATLLRAGYRPVGLIIERSHGWGSHVIEFFAIGTAVVATSTEHEVEKPALVLPLSG